MCPNILCSEYDSKLFLPSRGSREDISPASLLLSGHESVEWLDRESPCHLHNRTAPGELVSSRSRNTHSGGWKVVRSGCRWWGRTAPSVSMGGRWKWMGNTAAPDWVCEHLVHVTYSKRIRFMWTDNEVSRYTEGACAIVCHRNCCYETIASVHFGAVMNYFAQHTIKTHALLVHVSEATCPLLITARWEGRRVASVPLPLLYDAIQVSMNLNIYLVSLVNN